jgi:hypothetical protein
VAEEPAVKNERFGGDELPADVVSRGLEAVLAKVLRWAAGGFGAKPIAHSHADADRVSANVYHSLPIAYWPLLQLIRRRRKKCFPQCSGSQGSLISGKSFVYEQYVRWH